MYRYILLFGFIFCSLFGFSQHFIVDSIRYKITSQTHKTVEVTEETEINYKGNITIPDSVYYAGYYYKVTAIGEAAFFWCDSLISITLPESIKVINDRAFICCKKLRTVNWGNSIETIDNSAFAYCDSIVFLDLPDSLKYIGDNAFASNKATSINIGKNVNYIGSNAFSGCTKLTSINVDPDNLHFTSVDGVLFDKNKTVLLKFPPAKTGHYIIPDETVTIWSGAFSSCKNPYSVKLGNSVESIQTFAFYESTGLTAVEFNNNLKKIGRQAFYNCLDLESVILPNSCDSIYVQAFQGCSSLVSVKLPDNLEILQPDVFIDCISLSEINLPASLKGIGGYCFYNCRSLRYIEIPDSITNIYESTFENCLFLDSVKLSPNITKIWNKAFKNCQSLKSIQLPESVTTLGTEVFYYCKELTEIVFPQNITEIPEKAFYQCYKLKNIVFNPNIYRIGKESFRKCTSLNYIQFTSPLWDIKESAFSNCTELDSIKFLYHVSSIEYRTFYKCTELEKISMCGAYPPGLGEEVFYDVPTTLSVNILNEYLPNYQNSWQWNVYRLNGIDDCGTLAVSTEELSEISLYPNPSNGIISIKNPKETGIYFELYNTNGQLEMNAIVSSQSEIIINDLKPGIHYYIISENDQRKTGKLLIAE